MSFKRLGEVPRRHTAATWSTVAAERLRLKSYSGADGLARDSRKVLVLHDRRPPNCIVRPDRSCANLGEAGILGRVMVQRVVSKPTEADVVGRTLAHY
jgi:hypothetical protein